MTAEATWRTWGSTARERSMPFPGDAVMPAPVTLHRGIDVLGAAHSRLLAAATS
jgi:hypothetical protein